ncbi:restriction endonuclease subunit S [Campylobacter upsaliensis]|uniref:restriction endonuclease subunit S n=1 Tax=Campylobacter upsaliensis TaxID=28080 RepID=UPI0012CF0796|nr:restriction endonuclease subunit S [Campylobacter upsaliensis]EAH6863839.1 restriction endonuclease subunit S [Campylobacter upsaliensis]EAL3993990.1 restriction endonuclease subunit S [Campylobacter upsaliensis]ELM9574209.1 restriction endonuclease subunit S [Campylobacter upsaliensis]
MKKHTQSPCERSEISYKPSSIKWLGEIPQSWEIKPLRAIFNQRNEQNNNLEFQTILSLVKDVGVIPYEEKGNVGNKAKDDLQGYKIARVNDLVLNKMNAVIGSLGVSKYNGLVSPIYLVLYIANPNYLITYYSYLFQIKSVQKFLRKFAYGIMEIRESIDYLEFKKMFLPLPPLQEQKEIAEFLDKKCEKIQNYIDKKQKLITLLQEKKQALINEVVTKGLNPNIEFKNSEIEYLGLIPHHWEVVKVKYIATTNIGLVYDPSEIATNENVGYPVLRANNIQNGKIDYKDVIYVAKKIDDKQLAISGDLLMCVRNGSENLLGKTAKIENNNFSFGAFTAIIRSDLNNYLYWIFQTEMLKKSISSFIVSIGIGQISQDDIKNFKIPLPPLQEQKEIAEFLDKKCEKINSAIEKTKKQIELVKEYKNTLINEAVCGRIDL